MLGRGKACTKPDHLISNQGADFLETVAEKHEFQGPEVGAKNGIEIVRPGVA